MPRMTTLIATNASFTHIKVEATSPFMGKSTMELPLSLGEFQQGIDKWDRGAYVQDAFPTLNAGQREFLMTGMTPQVWDKTFPKEEDDA